LDKVHTLTLQHMKRSLVLLLSLISWCLICPFAGSIWIQGSSW